MQALIDQLERLQGITAKELEVKCIFQLLGSASEELGEVSTALRLEENGSGNGSKTVTESARDESVDLAICALSMFFARGGQIDDLVTVMRCKLDKWQANQSDYTNQS